MTVWLLSHALTSLFHADQPYKHSTATAHELADFFKAKRLDFLQIISLLFIFRLFFFIFLCMMDGKLNYIAFKLEKRVEEKKCNNWNYNGSIIPERWIDFQTLNPGIFILSLMEK